MGVDIEERIPRGIQRSLPHTLITAGVNFRSNNLTGRIHRNVDDHLAASFALISGNLQMTARTHGIDQRKRNRYPTFGPGIRRRFSRSIISHPFADGPFFSQSPLVSIPIGPHPITDRLGFLLQGGIVRHTFATRSLGRCILIGILIADILPSGIILCHLPLAHLLLQTHLLELQFRQCFHIDNDSLNGGLGPDHNLPRNKHNTQNQIGYQCNTQSYPMVISPFACIGFLIFEGKMQLGWTRIFFRFSHGMPVYH